MRLSDMRGPRRDDAQVPPEVDAELEALDAALRGDDVPEGMEGLEALVSDLRADRPDPDPDWSSELDSWAAAGFPRGARPGPKKAREETGTSEGAGDRPAGARAFASSFRRRRWMPVMAAAATLLVVVVSVSQFGDFGGEEDGGGVATQADDGGAEGEFGAAPEGFDLNSAPPSSDGAQGLGAEEDARALRDAEAGFLRNGRPGIARGQEKRRVERDAELTLAAPADEVPDVTDRAIDVVEGANGVVLNSRVTGSEESARATLELQVPTASLDTVLAELSDLANVRSRSEQAVDITKSFVTAKDRLVGLRAERDNLATRIREAGTDAEVDALQAQLAGVNQRVADAQNELERVEVRAQLSSVTLQITSDGASEAEEDDGWSISEALDDAGRVLEVGAGVALISAAVLVPLAIIAAIAYMTLGAANRRARERALDE